MDTQTLIVIAAVAVVVIVGLVLYLKSRRERRSQQLRAKFGPEYARLMEADGDRSRAEAELVARQKRVSQFTIHPLQPAEQARYQSAWTKVQTTFVDSPQDACRQADTLVEDVMAKRGYPVRDFEQKAADLSVDYPIVVQNYRSAHEIALRNKEGDAQTEDLRQAMIHYHVLFEELVTKPSAPS